LKTVVRNYLGLVRIRVRPMLFTTHAHIRILSWMLSAYVSNARLWFLMLLVMTVFRPERHGQMNCPTWHVPRLGLIAKVNSQRAFFVQRLSQGENGYGLFAEQRNAGW